MRLPSRYVSFPELRIFTDAAVVILCHGYLTDSHTMFSHLA